ncbi:MAG: hypothetical protein U0930_13150 [Pirellulales bacterium]
MEINPEEEMDYFGEGAWLLDGCWSAEFDLFKSGQATTMDFRDAIGTRTRMSSVITALWRGMARGAAALIQDLKQSGLLEDTLCFGPLSLDDCLRLKLVKVEITIRSSLPTGFVVEASKAESATGQAINGATSRWIGPSPHRCMMSMRQFCIC